MTTQPSAGDAARLLHQLKKSINSGHQPQPEKSLPSQLLLLYTWQSERLARTHADLLTHPQYAPAARFFLSDVYAPQDFTQRDYDIERMYAFMLKFLPAPLLKPLSRAIELNTMTRELDHSLSDTLVNQLGVTTQISEAQYAEAYRICDNYDTRVRQIEMIVEIGKDLSRIAHLPLIAFAIRMAKRPAHKAGWHQMQSFLERGLSAFKSMKTPYEFLEIISTRERKILDQIYQNHPNPFDI